MPAHALAYVACWCRLAFFSGSELERAGRAAKACLIHFSQNLIDATTATLTIAKPAYYPCCVCVLRQRLHVCGPPGATGNQQNAPVVRHANNLSHNRRGNALLVPNNDTTMKTLRILSRSSPAAPAATPKARHLPSTFVAGVVVVLLTSTALFLNQASSSSSRLLYPRCRCDTERRLPAYTHDHLREQQDQQLALHAPRPHDGNTTTPQLFAVDTTALFARLKNEGGDAQPSSSSPSSSTLPPRNAVLLTLAYGDMVGKIQPNDTFEATADKCGKNIGNLVWLYAATHCILGAQSNEILTSSSSLKDKTLALVVTPSANILWNLTDLLAAGEQARNSMLSGFRRMRPAANASTRTAAGAAAATAPRFILGLGVKGYESVGESAGKHHGDIGEVFTRKLHPSDYVLHADYVETLVAIVGPPQGQEQSAIGGGIIGVRGRFTEAVLRNHGVAQGVAALGCPSLFLNPTLDMGAVLQRKIDALGPDSRIVINMPQRWVPRLMTLLIRLALSSDKYTIVWQSPTDYWFNHRANWDLKLPKVPAERIRWFRDYESWSTFVCQHDAVIGSRIHGNMIGLSCPIPPLLIASDVRTYEMGQSMRLPMLLTNATVFRDLWGMLDDLGKSGGGGGGGGEAGAASNSPRRRPLPPVKELFQAAATAGSGSSGDGKSNFDAAAFDRNRYEQAARYKEELLRFGLTPSRTIASLASLHVGGTPPRTEVGFF